MTTIADAARTISTELDITPDAALTLATTYAAQLGYDVPEGGQAPDDQVTVEDAVHIVEGARAAAEVDA